MATAPRVVEVQGRKVPSFFYGTAWKEERTAALTRLALGAGFRAIDTANQRRHYFEAAVGEGIAAAIGDGVLTREDLFLQTKFTSVGGQDHRLPYDPDADPGSQVRESFERSLSHLRTTYIDSLVLHGPSRAHGLTDEDWEVWRAMEALHGTGRVHLLGASNVSLDQITTLHRGALVKPAFVQNRCFARMGWDRALRNFCRKEAIVYQGFSLLTANARELRHPAVAEAARRAGRTVAQVAFRFSLQVGMIPLTGTSSEAHMKEDLGAYDFELDEGEVEAIEASAG